MTVGCVQALPCSIGVEARERTCDRTSLRLDAHHENQLVALIEAIPARAFLVDERDRVVHMNAQARRLWREGREEAASAVRAARDGLSRTGLIVTRLTGASLGWMLVVLASCEAERAQRAGRTWGATPKQLRVLELLVYGKCNKEIGAALGCAEVTVEKHLTGLFQRSGTRSRMELVAQLTRF